MGKLSSKARLFDRGLPDSYDPHYFYEYRIALRSKEATGVEGFVYKLIPWNLIRSFAFAIDPLSSFKTSAGKISPVIRNLSRTISSVLDTSRTEYNIWITTGRAAEKNYQGHSGRYGPIVKAFDPVIDRWTGAKQPQEPLPWRRKDTTYRTRPAGYSMGEFEKSKNSIYSSPRSVHGYSNGTQYFSVGEGQDYPDFNQSLRSKDHRIGPSAAIYQSFHYNNLVNSEMDFLLSVMKEKALPMYKGINPQHRNYSLFRNIVELRDLPRSIIQLRDTTRNLIQNYESLFDPNVHNRLRKFVNSVNTSVKDIPKEYLSYHFGWKQLYNDITDLLVKPQRISDQIDFLIRRSGKPTTFRAKRVIPPSGLSEVPGFDYELLYGETRKSIGTSIRREIELNMVINTTFQFPTVNRPKFRNDLFNEKLGVYPRATDLYNLVPWTWLVDWFTGLGNYIEIIDEINHDRSLINWGLITGKSKVILQTNHVTELTSDSSISVNNIGETVFSKTSYNHTSVCLLDLQLRKNVAGIFDVKTFSDPSTLSDYQKSILGALLAQRTKFKA